MDAVICGRRENALMGAVICDGCDGIHICRNWRISTFGRIHYVSLCQDCDCKLFKVIGL